MVDPNPKLAAAGVVSRIPEIESVLRLRSGEVAVLGGLMREDSREDTAGVPLLSRLPGIGSAFRYRDRQQDKTELVVFLRPTVVREPRLAGGLRKFRRWWPSPDGPFGTNEAEPVRARAREPDPNPAATGTGALPPVGGAPARVRIGRSWTAPPADDALQRAWAAFRRGDHRKARAIYLEALDAHPAEALAGLGAVALRDRRIAAARAWYGRLVAIAPEDEAARTMSIVLDEGQDPAARERAVALRIARVPETAWLRVALGNLLAGRGDWDAAANAYRAARRLAPSNPDGAYNLAVASDRRALPRKALAEYRDALELAELSPPAFDVAAVRDRAEALERRLELQR